MLEITFFNTFHATFNRAPITGFISNKARALLAYLALEPGPHLRETLAGLLWPDQPEKKALHSLRSALSNLRKIVPNPDYFLADTQGIHLNPALPLHTDVTAFRRALQPWQDHAHRPPELCPACAAALATALPLYTGASLAGFYLPDSILFDEWSTLQRENLRLLALDALHHLRAYHAHRGEHPQTLQYARRQLELEPWNEDAHQALMLALAHTGQRSAALAQYKTLRTTLARELGLEPSPHTVRLYTRIRDAQPLHTLPPAPGPLFGREAELAAIHARLNTADLRLLTLTGPGGIGKTRLALAAAERLAPTFLHGVLFVPLAALANAAHLPAALLEAAHLTPSSNRPLQTQLLDYLREKELLLILDNCENLLDGMELIISLLENAPALKILTTSREPLHLRAEHLLEIEGLPYPVAPPNPDNPRLPAVEMFLTLAGQVTPNLTLTPATAPHIYQICQTIEGMPLALELAAPLTRVIPLPELAARLTHALDTLTTHMRDLPPRHRSVRAALEGSWDALPPVEQHLLGQLAIFRGGFTLPAAQAVAHAIPATLASLRDKSLLRLTAEGRYDMHTFIRQFAHEKHGEDQALCLRHAEWALQWLAHKAPALQLAHNAALTRTATELQNLRLAWDTALRHARADLLAPALPGLEGFYTARSGYAEMTEAFQKAAEVFPAEVYPALHIHLLTGQGVGLYQQGRAQDAQRILERAYMLAQTLDQPALLATCALHFGNVHVLLSDYETAWKYLGEARTLARQCHDPLTEAHVLRNFAIIHAEKGNLEEAYHLTETSLQLYQDAENELGAALATVNLSTTAHYLGWHDQIRQFAEKALPMGKALENRRVISLALSNLGLAAFARKAHEEAIRYYEEAKKNYQDIGNPVDIARTEITIANALQELGRTGEAISLHKQAYKLLQGTGQRWLIVLTLNNLGWGCLLQEDYEQAKRYLAQGLKEAMEIKADTLAHAILAGYADLYLRQGQPESGTRLAAFVREISVSDFENQESADEVLAKAKQMLPAEGFARSMEAGQQLTFEEAVKIVSEDVVIFLK